MKGKYIGTAAFLLAILVLIAGCNLLPPDLALRAVDPSYTVIGGNVQITFRLYNSGSEALQNCKVRWYVDGIDGDGSDGTVEYDEVTAWAPTIGVNLAVGETSSVFTVNTTSGTYSSPIDFYGMYEMGWNYSSDD
jgi:hypothetical protein